jgi:hypothetical protein
MKTLAYIPPNFGFKQFGTDVEAVHFLRQYGFELVTRGADHKVWETTRTPKRRAISFEREGVHIAMQLFGGI